MHLTPRRPQYGIQLRGWPKPTAISTDKQAVLLRLAAYRLDYPTARMVVLATPDSAWETVPYEQEMD